MDEVGCCLYDDVFFKTVVGGCDDYNEVGRSEVRTNDCLVDGGGGRRNTLVLIRDRAISKPPRTWIMR
jgi:hypothetical protein